MTLPSEKIFGAFESKRLLGKIAKKRCLSATDDNGELLSKADIIKILSEDVRDLGFQRMLQALSLKELKLLDELIPRDKDEKVPGVKRVLAKKIKEYCDDVGVGEFFNTVPVTTQELILKTLDIECGNPKQYTKEILAEAEAIGQDNCFSSFTAEQLAKFALSCDLDVDSLSQNVLVDSLMNLQNYKAPKKKSLPKPSKHKPKKIENGITKIDLQTHYTKEELVNFCKEEKITSHGNKKDVINNILAHVEGRELPSAKKGKKKGRKKKSSTEGKKGSKRSKGESSGEAAPNKKKKESTTGKKNDAASSESLSEASDKKK